MKLNRYIAILLLTLLGISSCRAEVAEDDVPVFIKNKIKEIKEGEVWNPPAKVFRYKYNGSAVYFFPARCCDVQSELYDENFTKICSPNGGYSGRGDGKCLDFLQHRTEEELIWEDTRKPNKN